MDVKKLLLATGLGFIIMFFLGWLGHQVIIPGLYDSSPTASIEREAPIIYGIVAAYLVIALIMSYLYPKGIEGESVFGNGLRFGLIIGLLIALPVSLILYSTIPMEFSMVISEGVWHMFEQGIGGIAIAYIYGIDSMDSGDSSRHDEDHSTSQF